jgi:hypothetical protein
MVFASFGRENSADDANHCGVFQLHVTDAPASSPTISRLVSCKMSTDPYHVVQHEIQSLLQTVATLRTSFLCIQNMARDSSEELV